LDDVIVGAPYKIGSRPESIGKSYVIFGKTDSTAIDLSAISNGTGSIPPLPIRMSSPMPATNISSSLAPVKVLSFSLPK
jgi:hypothetical protein